jgi:plasmid stabilization system protein ParE
LKITVSSAALSDLERLRGFLAKHNPHAAQRATAAIIQAIDSLMLFPDRGHPTGQPDLRDLVVRFGRSAYLIRFAHDRQRDELIVVRIWHAREDRD